MVVCEKISILKAKKSDTKHNQEWWLLDKDQKENLEAE